MPNRVALVVGINAYPGAPLNGCLADADYMATLLAERGFAVKTLRDGAATCAGITREVANLLAQLDGPGSYGVISYSGHGAQVRDLDGDEGDRLDETVCPVDFDFSNKATWLTDDVMHDLVVAANLPAGASLLVNLDSCHAGTMLRPFPASSFASGQRPLVKAMAPPEGMREAAVPLSFTRRLFGLGVRRNLFGARLLRANTKADVALLAATKAKQLAADAYIQGSYHGAHTWALQLAMKMSPTGSLREVRSGMQTWLDAQGYGGTEGQTPTLYGSLRMRGRGFLVAGS